MVLLTEVLLALGRARLLQSCYVVSPDKVMLALAARFGCTAVPESKDSGVNSAVLRGLAAIGGRTDVLVIPADLPLLAASDLRRVVELKAQGVDAVMAPSGAFDGTNALLFETATGFPLSYDEDSFWNHLEGAARRGLSVGVSTEPGLTFDVDSPDDLRALARSKSLRAPAKFARRVLR